MNLSNDFENENDDDEENYEKKDPDIPLSADFTKPS